MSQNETQSEVARLRDEVSELRQERDRRQTMKIRWLRIVTVLIMILIAAAMVFKMIDLELEARPQISTGRILLSDVVAPIAQLFLFGYAVFMFTKTFGESWLTRDPNRPADAR